MFEKTLSASLKRIFDLKKVTFDLPSESQEQECMFIEVDSSKNTIKDGQAIARVTGKLRVFGNADKLPYGYFSKKIQSADLSDTKDFFFFDLEQNVGTFQNIMERTIGFVYFFNSQYDPATGTLNQLNTTYVES